MAQIYKRIYTYTGQASWTANARSVPFSGFAVSGDTSKPIGQIVSIRYEHTHSSTSSRDWTLTARLLLSDGTTIDSAPLTQRISKNAVAQFVNGFTTLPTAVQFAQIATVQVLDTNGSPDNNGVLTWKANAQLPIRLIVEFYDQPPTKYAPQISNFQVERVNSSNQPTFEGTYISTTLKLSLASGAPVDQATLKLYTSTSSDATGTETDLTSLIPAMIYGVQLDTTVIAGQYSAGTTWYFTLVFAIGSETATATAQAFRAKAPIHITNNGVSFGGFSSATESDPREEFHNRVVFHKGFSLGGYSDLLTGIGIQAGLVSVSVDNYTYTEVQVTFQHEFEYNPIVVVGFETGSVAPTFGRCSCGVWERTTTGFKIRVYNNDSETRTPGVSWIAVGIPK